MSDSKSWYQPGGKILHTEGDEYDKDYKKTKYPHPDTRFNFSNVDMLSLLVVFSVPGGYLFFCVLSACGCAFGVYVCVRVRECATCANCWHQQLSNVQFPCVGRHRFVYLSVCLGFVCVCSVYFLHVRTAFLSRVEKLITRLLVFRRDPLNPTQPG